MLTSTQDGVRVGEKQARRRQGCLRHIINVFANFKRSEVNGALVCVFRQCCRIPHNPSWWTLNLALSQAQNKREVSVQPGA